MARNVAINVRIMDCTNLNMLKAEMPLLLKAAAVGCADCTGVVSVGSGVT